MAHIKVFTKEKLPNEVLSICWIRLDYIRNDEDSVFYPEPTHEYFYDWDEEDETYESFIDNLHTIYGTLDRLGIEYDYCILDGEYRWPHNEVYMKALKELEVNNE